MKSPLESKIGLEVLKVGAVAAGFYLLYKAVKGELAGVFDELKGFLGLGQVVTTYDNLGNAVAVSVRGQILEPAEGGIANKNNFRASYPLKFSITNHSDREASIPVTVRVEEIPGVGSNQVTVKTYVVTVGARKTQETHDLEFPNSAAALFGINAVATLEVGGRILDTASYKIE
jgi:hypothetical protein